MYSIETHKEHPAGSRHYARYQLGLNYERNHSPPLHWLAKGTFFDEMVPLSASAGVMKYWYVVFQIEVAMSRNSWLWYER